MEQWSRGHRTVALEIGSDNCWVNWVLASETINSKYLCNWCFLKSTRFPGTVEWWQMLTGFNYRHSYVDQDKQGLYKEERKILNLTKALWVMLNVACKFCIVFLLQSLILDWQSLEELCSELGIFWATGHSCCDCICMSLVLSVWEHLRSAAQQF